MQHGLAIADHERVAGVVPTLETHDRMGAVSQYVDDGALALVAPLQSRSRQRFDPRLASHAEQQRQSRDDCRQAEEPQLVIRKPGQSGQTTPPMLRRSEWEKPLENQVESQTRKKICPGQRPKPP